MWESDIVPSWRAVLREHKLRKLWWEGTMPENWRGRLWASVIGNALALAKTDYARALKRLDGDESKSEKLRSSVKASVEHVLPDLHLFQEGRPMHDELVELASAVCVYYSVWQCVRVEVHT